MEGIHTCGSQRIAFGSQISCHRFQESNSLSSGWSCQLSYLFVSISQSLLDFFCIIYVFVCMCVYIHKTVEARWGASDPSELELLVFVSWDPSSGPQNKQQVLLTANPSLYTNTPCLDHSVSILYKRILWRGTIRIASLSWDWHYVKLNHLLICDITFWQNFSLAWNQPVSTSSVWEYTNNCHHVWLCLFNGT